MSNGNTATQVSPVSESEMTNISKIFQRVAESIVAATSLSQEVDALRAQVQSINNDMEYQRSRNAELDAQVSDVRRQRDEAEAKLAEAELTNSKLQTELQSAQSSVAGYEHRIEALESTLSSTRKDRDDAAFKNLELTEELNALKAKWSKFENLIAAPATDTAIPRQVAQAPQPAQNQNYGNNPTNRNWG